MACNLRLYIQKEDEYYLVRVIVDEPIYIGDKHGYRYGMNNSKFYMGRMTFDEEGNVCRFLSSILDNEGKLIILEEQYQDFYKYVLLQFFLILKCLMKLKMIYQLMMKSKFMEIL